MTHWGWYWEVKKKHQARKLCSYLPSIDSFKLFKKDHNIAGFIIKPFDIKAELEERVLKITYGKHKEHSYLISIDKQSCNYGGFRNYFKCPLCQRRMRILYFVEQSLLLCRKCLNLSYESQRLRSSKRYDYMSQKIKDYIQSKKGDLYNKKPKNMHNSTYYRLKNKQLEYERKFHQALNQELRQWYGSKIEPYLEDF